MREEVWLTVLPTSWATRIDAQPFVSCCFADSTSLPLDSSHLCGRPLDKFGHDRAAYAEAGVLWKGVS